MKKTGIFLILLLWVVWQSCRQQMAHKQPAGAAEDVKQYYLACIRATGTAVQQLEAATRSGAKAPQLQSLFLQARLVYKQAEMFAEYYTPLTSKSINGAPIPSMDENDQHKTEAPEGFQVIEPFLFPAPDSLDTTHLLQQTRVLVANLKRLELLAQQQFFAHAQVFDALRLEIFRVITLGLSGFDTPIAQNAVPEAAAALVSVQKVLDLYRDSLTTHSDTVYRHCQTLLQQAGIYLQAHNNFNGFNRMLFLIQYANPLSLALLQAGKIVAPEPFRELRPLRADAASLFDTHAFNPDYYTASSAAHSSQDKVILGEYLFFDPVLSGNGRRACASCHQPAKAFTDGMTKSLSLDGRSLVRRNTPTVLNAGLQPGLFYDLRVAYLEDQATDVITSATEMHGSLQYAVNRLQQSPAYAQLFARAFPSAADPVNSYNLRNALGSYIRSLSSLNAPFDRYVRGDHSQMSEAAVAGFNLFMGKAKCGTCHFMPLFNGTVPPHFTTVETEVIGVPATVGGNRIDPDPGRFALRHIALHRYGFRTPTVRNIALTAPYMHNGIYRSLKEVVDFYDKGGAAGLGIRLDNQTLPFDKLDLTEKEKQQLIAFLQTLTDTTASSRVPAKLPALDRRGVERKPVIGY